MPTTRPTHALYLGAAAAVAEITGDGRGDLVTHTSKWGGLVTPLESGRVRSSMAVPDAAVTLRGSNDPDAFGAGMASGDLDADGRADLVIGAPLDARTGVATGAVFVFWGGGL